MRKGKFLFFYRLRCITCYLFLVPCLWAGSAHANNLTLSNVSLTAPNATNKTIQIQFDIAWANSWRNQGNYDAVWVFVKYSTDSGTTWNHATLKTSGTNPSGVNRGFGTLLDILVSVDKKGAFIQRSSVGSGSVSTTSMQLVWDYNANSLTASSTARVKVLGIEMCYIPTGSFYVGDAMSGGSLRGHFESEASGTPFQVTGEGALTLGGGGAGSLGNNNAAGMAAYQYDDFDDATQQTLPAAFPKGYNAFYLMKHEITEGQWVDFFNCLTSTQKVKRDITAIGKSTDSVKYRNTVSWVSGDAATTAPNRACSYLSWADGCAYADWAALRPISELEYEKACRGPGAPVTGEYAWGSTSITAAVNISGAEDGTETITTSGANCAYSGTTFTGGDGGMGPLRAGIFATSTSSRQASGAGYYGNMDLSGNLTELVTSVGSAAGWGGGRRFDGSHGNGILNVNGFADHTWAGYGWTADGGVDDDYGSAYRGGSWNSTAEGISARYSITHDMSPQSWRRSYFGFRCARTESA